MPVTDQEARALTFLVKRRRDTLSHATKWDEPGIAAAISRVAHCDLGEVMAACARAATDKTLTTPAAIGDTRSSAWRERLVEPVPTRPRVCDVHGVQYAGIACPSCRADELAGDTRDTEEP